jgi:hypothetical protein
MLMAEDSNNRASQKTVEMCCDRSCFGTTITCTSEHSGNTEPFPEFFDEPNRRWSFSSKSDFPGLTVTEVVTVMYEINPHYSPPLSTPYEGYSTDEISPLLAAYIPSGKAEPVTTELTTIQFYVILSKQRRILVSLFSILTYSIIVSSFDATLPLHVQEAFGWRSSGSGAMFLALEAPGIVFGPLAGWLRDRLVVLLCFSIFVKQASSGC